ncbi:hypothetical protein Vi05172_g735 [Venturia inaequalis]|nr:hypothetical protein Vi05172_g735 [Venturia inaequalis]
MVHVQPSMGNIRMAASPSITSSCILLQASGLPPMYLAMPSALFPCATSSTETRYIESSTYRRIKLT